MRAITGRSMAKQNTTAQTNISTGTKKIDTINFVSLSIVVKISY